MSSKLITDIIDNSNGTIDVNFFLDANLTEVFTLLKDNEENLEIMKWVGKAFECYSTDRFIGVETETQLEELAQSLSEESDFFAGISSNIFKHFFKSFFFKSMGSS